MAINKENIERILNENNIKKEDIIELFSFNEIKDKYRKYRMDIRKEIIEKINKRNEAKKTDEKWALTIGGASGRGRSDYSTPDYDNTNWIWLEFDPIPNDDPLKDNRDKRFLLSFQPLDQDSSSKNYHALFDRIGLYIRNDNGKNHSFFEIPLKLDGSAYDLPLNEGDIDALLNYIENEFIVKVYDKLKSNKSYIIENFIK